MAVIDRLLAEARERIEPRVGPTELPAALAGGAIVVDIRPEAQRRRDGELPGSIVIERNVLEWRLDPSSPHRIPQADGTDRPIVIVCDEGYASCLAAAVLRDIGLVHATDLAGGYQAWVAAGRPSLPAGQDVRAGGGASPSGVSDRASAPSGSRFGPPPP